MAGSPDFSQMTIVPTKLPGQWLVTIDGETHLCATSDIEGAKLEWTAAKEISEKRRHDAVDRKRSHDAVMLRRHEHRGAIVKAEIDDVRSTLSTATPEQKPAIQARIDGLQSHLKRHEAFARGIKRRADDQ